LGGGLSYSDLGERAVGHDRGAILEPDRLGLRGVDQPLPVDVLAGIAELLVQGPHEPDHGPDPFGGPGLDHRALVTEHHDHVLHLVTPFACTRVGAHHRVGAVEAFSTSGGGNPRRAGNPGTSGRDGPAYGVGVTRLCGEGNSAAWETSLAAAVRPEILIGRFNRLPSHFGTAFAFALRSLGLSWHTVTADDGAFDSGTLDPAGTTTVEVAGKRLMILRVPDPSGDDRYDRRRLIRPVDWR
jgi:hypothetical protein